MWVFVPTGSWADNSIEQVMTALRPVREANASEMHPSLTRPRAKGGKTGRHRSYRAPDAPDADLPEEGWVEAKMPALTTPEESEGQPQMNGIHGCCRRRHRLHRSVARKRLLAC